MKLLIPIILLSLIPLAYGMYADIPPEPEVHFTAKVPQYAYIQRDFSFNIRAEDDRSAYYSNAPSIGKIYGADVKTIIYPSWTDKWIIQEISGKTSKRGYYSGNDFVTTNEYLPHALDNMTITVSYGNSVETQEFQFWTLEKE